VPTEAGERDQREQRERSERCERQASALAHARRAQDQIGKDEPRGGLHPDPGDKRDDGAARPRGSDRSSRVLRPPAGRAGASTHRQLIGRSCARPLRSAPRRQRQRAGQGQQHQRVVVGAAGGEQEQRGIEPDEGRGRRRRASHPPSRLGDQRDRAQAGRDRHGLQRPQAAAEPEQGERVGAEREQRAVGGVLEGPADESEHRVDRRFGGDVRVRVQPVQRAQAGERQVAEHVLGDQRRREQEQRVGRRDRTGQRAPRKRPRAHRREHRRVAGAKHQHPDLEAAPAELPAEPVQRPRQPGGPTAAARGHQLGGGARGAGGDDENAGRNGQRSKDPERAQGRRARGRRREKAPVLLSGCRGR
jgi:hypothetical protein